MLRNLLFLGLFFGLFFNFFALQAHEGHTHDAKVEVENAKIRTFMPAAPSSVGYLTLKNDSDHDATLVKVEIQTIGRVEIHEHVHKNGMMKMQQLKQLVIPANQEAVFQSGGLHLMLYQPSEPLKAGQQYRMTLHFKNGDRVFAMAEAFSLLHSEPQKSHENHNKHQHKH